MLRRRQLVTLRRKFAMRLSQRSQLALAPGDGAPHEATREQRSRALRFAVGVAAVALSNSWVVDGGDGS